MYNLAQIIANRHFISYINSDSSDLIEVGVLKAVELIKSGVYDKNRTSLKNYLYTGMRNEMKNYLNRMKKEILVDDTMLASRNSYTVMDYYNCYINITDDMIRSSIPFRITNQDFIKVKSSLKYLGFNLDHKSHVYYNEVSRYVGLVIWKIIKG